MKHCHAAETAHAAHNDAETHKELDAATQALERFALNLNHLTLPEIKDFNALSDT